MKKFLTSGLIMMALLITCLWGCASCKKGEATNLQTFAPQTKSDKTADKTKKNDKTKKPAFDYSQYAKALKYVDDKGMVNYKELKKNRKDLDGFVTALEKQSAKDYAKWTKKEQLAFWINAYNGLTLKVIINHYPIQSSFLKSITYPKNSIRQISGAWDSIKHNVMGKELVLNDIEHKILRKYFGEPRIHMALVCAAMGCPPLRNEPYDPKKIDDQLNDQSEKFIGHPKKFKIDQEGGTIYLSSIFNWFGKDFVEKYGTDKKFVGQSKAVRAVLNFISSYLSKEDKMTLVEKKYSISYFSYDWTLNEQ